MFSRKRRERKPGQDRWLLMFAMLSLMAANLYAMNGSNRLFVYGDGKYTVIAYLDPLFSVDERVNDLIDRMTITEKIGQLMQLPGSVNLSENILNKTCGSFLFMMGEDAAEAIELNRMTRLKIPLLFGIDAIHGHSFSKTATIFPTQLGFSSSWDADLAERIANITAYEMRYTGPSWTFSPVLCIARDLRWGRIGETFGEDPFLIGVLGEAMVRGLQGDSVSNDPNKVMACIKHFAGYSETIGGLDATPNELSRKTLLSYFLPPFKRCVKAGVGSVMSSYQAIDGVPAVANSWLLGYVLKYLWGFKGFVVSDWNGVGHLVKTQNIFETLTQAITRSLTAGNDMAMSTKLYYETSLKAVQDKKLNEYHVDEACKRILRMKFQLGLFEDERIPDLEKSLSRSGTKEHREVALEAALKSLILLKNDGILPITNASLKVALLGQNANNTERQLGDWTLCNRYNFSDRYDRNHTTTVYDALISRFDNLKYEPGCIIEKTDAGNLTEALDIAEDSDLVIIVVGDSFNYSGEFHSTATLQLMGDQIEMIDAVSESGVPFIIDVISSKPLILPESAQKASAIIQQFNPGMLGGEAFAQIIFGEKEPRGRLTVSIPSHTGQIPSYYQKPRGEHGFGYTDLSKRVGYPFGYGLTYTKFDYIDAEIDKQVYRYGETIKVSVIIQNTGTRNGTEIIQCYLHDNFTSVQWASHELKGFSAVTLEPGQEVNAEILIPVEECSIVNENEQRVVEPGDFELWVGTSSSDILFSLPFAIVGY